MTATRNQVGRTRVVHAARAHLHQLVLMAATGDAMLEDLKDLTEFGVVARADDGERHKTLHRAGRAGSRCISYL